jgi:hypothetical protein
MFDRFHPLAKTALGWSLIALIIGTTLTRRKPTGTRHELSYKWEIRLVGSAQELRNKKSEGEFPRPPWLSVNDCRIRRCRGCLPTASTVMLHVATLESAVVAIVVRGVSISAPVRRTVARGIGSGARLAGAADRFHWRHNDRLARLTDWLHGYRNDWLTCLADRSYRCRDHRLSRRGFADRDLVSIGPVVRVPPRVTVPGVPIIVPEVSVETAVTLGKTGSATVSSTSALGEGVGRRIVGGESSQSEHQGRYCSNRQFAKHCRVLPL